MKRVPMAFISCTNALHIDDVVILLYQGAHILVREQHRGAVMLHMTMHGVYQPACGGRLMLRDLRPWDVLVEQDHSSVLEASLLGCRGSGQSGGNGRDKIKPKYKIGFAIQVPCAGSSPLGPPPGL